MSEDCYGCAAFRDAAQGLVWAIDAGDAETKEIAIGVRRDLLAGDAGRNLAEYVEKVELFAAARGDVRGSLEQRTD